MLKIEETNRAQETIIEHLKGIYDFQQNEKIDVESLTDEDVKNITIYIAVLARTPSMNAPSMNAHAFLHNLPKKLFERICTMVCQHALDCQSSREQHFWHRPAEIIKQVGKLS